MNRSCYVGRSLEELNDVIGRATVGCCGSTVLGLGCLGINTLFPNSLTQVLFWSSCAYFLYKRKKDAEFSRNLDFYYKNSKEYITLEYSYSLVLKELLNLLEELGMDNEAKIAACYNYLYKNGYLSCNKSFSRTDLDDAGYCLYLFGTSVMTGMGNDKHLNSMLADLLRMDGYSAYCLSLLENEFAFEREYFSGTFLSDLAKIVDKGNNFTSKDEFHKNDTMTGVAVGGCCYLMDMYLNRLLGIDEDLTLSFRGNYSLFSHEYLNGSQNVKTVLFPTDEELLKLRKEDYFSVQRMCPDYTDTFERFYQEHRELYEEVTHKRRVLIQECSKHTYFKSMVK